MVDSHPEVAKIDKILLAKFYLQNCRNNVAIRVAIEAIVVMARLVRGSAKTSRTLASHSHFFGLATFLFHRFLLRAL